MQKQLEETLLYRIYSGFGAGLYPVLMLLCPLLERMSGRLGYGFSQRLGQYRERERVADRSSSIQAIWLHAASVGEVQAATVLVQALLPLLGQKRVIVTSTTEQGHRLASRRMPAGVSCLMAPLDLPQAVDKAIQKIRPCSFICLETELWPVMLTKMRQAGVTMLLLNGRLSERSLSRYQYVQGYMAALLQGFQGVAVISEADGRRYRILGVPLSRLQICGNLKDDMQAKDPESVRVESRRRLQLSDERVLLCGSTHDDEERQLLKVFQTLATQGPAVLVLAPRHLERIPVIEELLRQFDLPFDRFSALARSRRTAQVILIDTMGDLADLYAGADSVFCGGSLVERGGHNLMEAARWGRAVYFGPHMKDFHDLAALLVEAGGGFQVADAVALTKLLLTHIQRPEDYACACLRAAEVAARQRGAVARQVAIVHKALLKY